MFGKSLLLIVCLLVAVESVSWQTFVDHMTSSAHIADAAIWGIYEGEPEMWASSPGLTGITPEEIELLITEDLPTAFRTIDGDQYVILKNYGTCTLMKKVKATPNDIMESVVVGRSKIVIVIARGTAHANTTQVYWVVAEMTDYLNGIIF